MQVWDAGAAIAGFCTFREQLDEPGVTYVGVLNVVPAYQKLGLGRRFLTYFVGRSLERGAKRLDLHTWPGNLKAVPLYKKCGFFWMPGTGVHMFNFLPSILAMPAAKPFFDRHDWYASMRRELSQSEDDERWQGMKVFTYRFEAGGEQLTVRVDQQARAITAIETDAFGAAAIAT
ncbi:MAG: GNAT family N-acetyltransferase, partial [Chloroflexales bacterium]|nr:GNAT family N-acetyltransferase [Chloroflexales bacterium]